jgi:hypothetical protein
MIRDIKTVLHRSQATLVLDMAGAAALAVMLAAALLIPALV